MRKFLKISAKLFGKASRELCYWVITLFLLFPGVPLLLGLLTVILIYRSLIRLSARIFRPDLLGIVAAGSASFAVDDMSSPRNNIMVEIEIDGELSVEKASALIYERLIRPSHFPQLRCHYEGFGGYLFWVEDEDFNLERHVRPLSSPIDYCGLSKEPWTLDQSPWEFLVEIIPGLKTRVVFRYHHGLGDGYSILKMLLRNLAEVNDSRIALPRFPRRTLCEGLWFNLTKPVKIPYELTKQMIEGADTNAWVRDDKDPLYHVVQTAPIPMDLIKRAKRAHGVSFFAILVGAISGAIRSTFIEEGQGHLLPKVMSSCNAVPLPAHPLNKLTNYLTYLEIKFPTGVANPRERLRVVESNLASLKKSTLPSTNYYLSLGLGALPSPLLKMVREAVLTCTLVSSNFPGPDELATVFGHRVTSIKAFDGFYYGTPGVTILMLSYGGLMRVNLNVNRSIMPSEKSVDGLSRRILEEIESLARLNGEDIV